MTDNILIVRSPQLKQFAERFLYDYEQDIDKTPLHCHMFPLKYAGKYKDIPCYMFDIEEMFATAARVGAWNTDESQNDGKSKQLDDWQYDNKL